jgi:hypothetical protein
MTGLQGLEIDKVAGERVVNAQAHEMMNGSDREC